MIQLDYQTNNPKWGLSGVKFNDWESYAFTLGYLSNPAHHKHLYPNSSNANISIHIEKNNMQLAWGEEGRIHYYSVLNNLENYLNDLYNCSSKGVGSITRRINSNSYILSLKQDYNFQSI